jgi:hypothetical protein
VAGGVVAGGVVAGGVVAGGVVPGGVVAVPPVQATPLRVNAAGSVFVPGCAPLKPNAAVAPVARAAL